MTFTLPPLDVSLGKTLVWYLLAEDPDSDTRVKITYRHGPSPEILEGSQDLYDTGGTTGIKRGLDGNPADLDVTKFEYLVLAITVSDRSAASLKGVTLSLWAGSVPF